jgi:hypothetical protein
MPYAGLGSGPGALRWRELARQITEEKDPKKLIKLVEEILAEFAKAQGEKPPEGKSAFRP